MKSYNINRSPQVFQKIGGLFKVLVPKANRGLDDLAISNNGDTEKVLGTVVAALYAFFDRHPGAIVYATGSTPGRTRLYRMGITKFYEEIKNDF